MRVAAEDYKRCTLVALFFQSFSIYSGREQIKMQMHSSAWQEDGERQSWLWVSAASW